MSGKRLSGLLFALLFGFILTGTVTRAENSGKYEPGTYLVGRDIAPGKYLFTGTGEADIDYACPDDRFAEGTYDSEGSIWFSGDSVAIDLADQTCFRIRYNAVWIAPFEVKITEDKPFELPVGTYRVGTELDPGSYLFVGTGPTDIAYNCPDDRFTDDAYREETIREEGDAVVLNFKDNTYLRVKRYPAMVSRYQFSLPEGEEAELPVGIYHVGTQIPAGKYCLTGQEEEPTDIFYNCPDDRFADGTYLMERSIYSGRDTVLLDLAEDTYIDIQLHAVKIRKYAGIETEGDGAVLPVGVYLIGEDFPAGTYTFVGTDIAEICYNCPDNRFEEDSGMGYELIQDADDVVTITLKDNTYIKVISHPVLIRGE